LNRTCSDANIKPAILLETLIETLPVEDWEIVVQLVKDVQHDIESGHMLKTSRKLIALDCDNYEPDQTIDISENYYKRGRLYIG
jgi:flagellar basal body rod protein FlgF